MADHAMPAATARALLTAFHDGGISVCVGGGWAVDALVGEQTREHGDLDVWVEATETASLFAVLVALGIDRIHPWPDDRPWNFVVHDGGARRVDLHFYEPAGDGRLRYGSLTAPFEFTEQDVAGRGEIAGLPVRCEAPEFALANRTGYEQRDCDRHDVALLCERFGLPVPAGYR
jgi:lincosamide nucleotidyltransferase A/C/D/E